MDDRDFFDLLYAQWSKTTGAEDHYWQPEEDVKWYDRGPGTYTIWAVDDKQDKKYLASFDKEEDADFITALHGCFGDLVKRLHAAVDESDRLDLELDNTLGRVFVLETEADEKAQAVESCEARIVDLEAKLSDERGYSAYLQCDINYLRAEADEFSSIIGDLTEHISQLESGRV